MKNERMVVTIVAALFHLSLALPSQVGQHPGILTDRYGIVTDIDLDESENRCYGVGPFPPVRYACAQYWQCLPMNDVFVDCEDRGPTDDFDRAGAPIFWIRDGDVIHNYMTRRNFSLEACEEWIGEWKDVMEGEDVVCFYGDFLSREYWEGDSMTPPGMHYFWIIDRMKSRHGEWSYFHREPKDQPEN